MLGWCQLDYCVEMSVPSREIPLRILNYDRDPKDHPTDHYSGGSSLKMSRELEDLSNHANTADQHF
jgi:hypothetical protein